MSNPVFTQPATYTPRRIIRDAQVLARVGSSFDATDFLGGNAGGAERDEALAGLLNWSLEEFFRDFPHYGLKSTGFSLTAFNPFYDLPEDLHGSDLFDVRYNDPGTRYDGYRLQVLSTGDMRQVRPGLYTGMAQAEYPMGYAVVYDPKESRWRIQFVPTPTMAKSLVMTYRPKPPVYTGGNLDSTDPEHIIPVPDAYIEPLVYLIAERIQERNVGAKSPSPQGLREQYELIKKRLSYMEPPIDDLVSGGFIPEGQPSSVGWQDRDNWNALNDYEGMN